MKKNLIIGVIAIAAAVGLPAFAQEVPTDSVSVQEQCRDGKKQVSDNRKGDRRGGDRGLIDVTAMKDLNLTSQQITAIEELNKSQAEADKAARENAKARKKNNASQRKEAREQRRQDYLAKLKTILTPEQYQTVLEKSLTSKNDRGGRPGARSSHAGDNYFSK